jgi:hypothetical protein
MDKNKLQLEEITTQARDNLNAYILLTIAYLKHKGESVEEWLEFIGKKFSQTWPNLQQASLEDIAWGIVINNLSAGAQLVSLTSNDFEAEITLEGWPHNQYITLSDVSWLEAQTIHQVLAPVFANSDIKYTWSQQNNQVKIKLCRQIDNNTNNIQSLKAVKGS